MSQGGYGQGGASVAGPTSVFEGVPYEGYKHIRGAGHDEWVEEFLDAVGGDLDVWNQWLIVASQRATWIDPSTAESAASSTQATPTDAPELAISQDTMLDVLLFLEGYRWPTDGNLSIAQKQALVREGWDALTRKGTRIRLANLVAQITGGVVYPWSSPPDSFSIIVPDGAPEPGYGDWSPAAGANASQAPWILAAARLVLDRITPGFIYLGIGRSQFRAGYSSAGEPVLPTGCRINALAGEHFDAWTLGVPDGWTKTGTGTLTQASGVAKTNYEFTDFVAQIDLTAAVVGEFVALAQSAPINNQLDHVVEIDYAYTNGQLADVLVCQITDSNRDGNTYYYNDVLESWSTTAYSIPLPVRSSTTDRVRYSVTLSPQAASSSTVLQGTDRLQVLIKATSDNTPTTEVIYNLYRVGIYERYRVADEEAALGERTLWYPFHDSLFRPIASHAVGGDLVEVANAARTQYKVISQTASSALFEYHPGASGRGYRNSREWANLLPGSNDFLSGSGFWGGVSRTTTANAVISPIVGETVATATRIDATAVGASVTNASGVVPTSKDYIAGVWCKKVSADTAPAGTAAFTAGSSAVVGTGTAFTTDWVGFEIRPAGQPTKAYLILTVSSATSLTLAEAASATESGAFEVSTIKLALETTSTRTQTHFLAQADGWRWLAMRPAAFGAGDIAALTLRVSLPLESTAQIALTTAYLYDVTTYYAGDIDGLLYPPIVIRAGAGASSVQPTSTTESLGAGVPHPLTQRPLINIASGGLLACKVVPTFSASWTHSGTIFHAAHAGASSTAKPGLWVFSSGTSFQVILSGGVTSATQVTLSLTTDETPAAGSVTWIRDREIQIYVRWDTLGNLHVSAGNGSGAAAGAAGWAVLADPVTTITMGIGQLALPPSSGQFDGLIYDLEVVQIGAQ